MSINQITSKFCIPKEEHFVSTIPRKIKELEGYQQNQNLKFGQSFKYSRKVTNNFALSIFWLNFYWWPCIYSRTLINV